MKRHTPFLALVILLMACEAPVSYQIESRDLILMDDERCQIKHHYPQLSGLKDSLLQQGLNRHFRELNGLFSAGADCLQDSLSTQISSSYRIHQAKDTLLSIELFKDRSISGEERRIRTYYPLTIKLPEGFFQPLELSLNEQQWTKMQEKLESWQKAKPQSRRYNQASYTWGDTDLIPFCLSSDSLILFPGGEGEGHSFQRFSIPLIDLQ